MVDVSQAKARRLPGRYRKPLFAFAMSASTALLVSAVILLLRGVAADDFVRQWGKAFIMAWPVVFIAIILLAPLIERGLDWVVEKSE